MEDGSQHPPWASRCSHICKNMYTHVETRIQYIHDTNTWNMGNNIKWGESYGWYRYLGIFCYLALSWPLAHLTSLSYGFHSVLPYCRSQLFLSPYSPTSTLSMFLFEIRAWQYMPLILACKRQRKVVRCEFKASLGYMESSRPARLHSETSS